MRNYNHSNMNSDGLELFAKECTSLVEEVYTRTPGIYGGVIACARILNLKHPDVVAYETRNAEREAFVKGACAALANSGLGEDYYFPALPDPRVPTRTPREVTFSTGWTAQVVSAGMVRWSFGPKGPGERGATDPLSGALSTPADFRKYADLLENPYESR